MEKKKIKCEECGKEQEYFDNAVEVMYTLFPTNKKVCYSCFMKEQEKAKEQWRKDHPCPFKMETVAVNSATGKVGEITTVCTLQGRYSKGCIGEKNCPIYNGGMK